MSLTWQATHFTIMKNNQSQRDRVTSGLLLVEERRFTSHLPIGLRASLSIVDCASGARVAAHDYTLRTSRLR